MKKLKISPYANIDWNKAASLFGQKSGMPDTRVHKTAETLLYELVRFAERGLVFLAHAENPAAVEYALHGTGPLSWETRRIINRFEKQKYVTVRRGVNGETIVKITKRGHDRALSYHLDTMKLQKSAHWDHKWRVVIFDVPENNKRLRDLFRRRLRQLELYRLQESVYVSPYSCFDEVEFLRELFGVALHVRYLIVEKIEEDESLRRHFHLQ